MDLIPQDDKTSPGLALGSRVAQEEGEAPHARRVYNLWALSRDARPSWEDPLPSILLPLLRSFICELGNVSSGRAERHSRPPRYKALHLGSPGSLLLAAAPGATVPCFLFCYWSYFFLSLIVTCLLSLLLLVSHLPSGVTAYYLPHLLLLLTLHSQHLAIQISIPCLAPGDQRYCSLPLA